MAPKRERIEAGVVIGACSAALALLEVFLIPLRDGTAAVPVAVVLALVANFVAPGLMRWATQVPALAFAPPVLWFLIVGPGTISGPGGDVLIPGNWQGWGFLLAGVVGILGGLVYDAARSAAAAGRRTDAAPVRGPVAPQPAGSRPVEAMRRPDKLTRNGKRRAGRPRSGR
ncbi:MAG: hypothetical protein ACR2F6_06625 [Mycobacteriales bacterium]